MLTIGTQQINCNRASGIDYHHIVMAYRCSAEQAKPAVNADTIGWPISITHAMTNFEGEEFMNILRHKKVVETR